MGSAVRSSTSRVGVDHSRLSRSSRAVQATSGTNSGGASKPPTDICCSSGIEVEKLDDPFTLHDADASGRSHHRVRPNLSSISLILGICSPVSSFIIPSLLGSDLSHPSGRLVSLIPTTMMLAGFAIALVARKRGEVGRLTSTALAWNSLLLIFYAVALTALVISPVTPT